MIEIRSRAQAGSPSRQPTAWRMTRCHGAGGAAGLRPAHVLADYRIVHFATHGLLNTSRPELSGLVFSMVDEGGRERDGKEKHENNGRNNPPDIASELHLIPLMIVRRLWQTSLPKERPPCVIPHPLVGPKKT